MAIYIIRTEEILTQRRRDAKTQRLLLGSFLAALRLCVFALIFFLPVAAQKLAILTPDSSVRSRNVAESLSRVLDDKLTVLDSSMSETAYSSVSPATPFNLTAEEAKHIGAVIGCDFFILTRAETLRRSAYRRAEYYETYAAIYVVSSRTGRLALSRVSSFEAESSDKTEKMLASSLPSLAAEIEHNIRSTTKSELSEISLPMLAEIPDENSPLSKNFRAPIPYRRIKPEYTAEAALYDITATVEILVDLGASGTILRTNIVRWAGFGLDESAERAVRQMNWRPAEQNGKPLPMRFLVRYNFRKSSGKKPE